MRGNACREVREYMVKALDCIRSSASTVHPQSRFAVLRDKNVLRCQISDSASPLADDLYDHDYHRREFHISERMATAVATHWRKTHRDERWREMWCALFLVHEFYHVGQNIGSDTHRMTRATPATVLRYDYAADAFAADVVFQLYRTDRHWRDDLGEVVWMLVASSSLFGAIGGAGGGGIQGKRLARDLAWMYQYARAMSFSPEASSGDFDLHDPVGIDLLRTDTAGGTTNLGTLGLVSESDFREALELQISHQGRRWIHRVLPSDYSPFLGKAVFAADSRSAYELFRPHWSHYPELVGEPHSALRVHADVLYECNDAVVTIDTVNEVYRIEFRKIITNTSKEPLTRVNYFVLADPFPDDPILSDARYAECPFDWESLCFWAEDDFGELDVSLDRDLGRRKDFEIRFAIMNVSRPVPPQERRMLRYGYQVSFNNWGSYIDRPIYFPTVRCSVRVVHAEYPDLQVGCVLLSPFRNREHMLSGFSKGPGRPGGPVSSTLWSLTTPQVGVVYRVQWTPPRGAS